MAIAASFPTIRPSRLLDFATSGVLDPRITFSRSTTATYYDGVTTAKAEENLFLRSQEFNTGWTPTNATITADATSAPDGTTTADTLAATATSAGGTYALQNINFQTASYTFSLFAKADTTSVVWLYSRNAALFGYAYFDLSDQSTQAVAGSSTTPTNLAITSIGSGWYRVSATFSVTALNSGCGFGVSDAKGATDVTAGASMYLWGAQLEQRSSVTAYTPTTTQPITNYIPVLQTAAANVARFDHNPTTGEALGLLIEEQRTNLLTYSADFSNASWTKTNTAVTTNAIVAPNGTLTGDKLIENTTVLSSYQLTQTVTPKPSSNPTITIYAKPAGRNWIYLNVFPSTPNDFTNDTRAYFDILNGAVGTVTRGTASITAAGNGWYRCSLTASQFSSSASANATCVIQLATANGTNSYTGDGYSGIFIWGAQLEVGAFPTSYIATTSATVTRNADAASMTGTNFSSWFNNAEGVFYVDAGAAQGFVPVLLTTYDTGGTNLIRIAKESSTASSTTVVSVRSYTSGTEYVLLNSAFASGKFSVGYAANNFALAASGSVSPPDTTALVPVMSRMTIGWDGFNTARQINSTIRKIAYYPERLTDANLQALTA